MGRRLRDRQTDKERHDQKDKIGRQTISIDRERHTNNRRERVHCAAYMPT